MDNFSVSKNEDGSHRVEITVPKGFDLSLIFELGIELYDAESNGRPPSSSFEPSTPQSEINVSIEDLSITEKVVLRAMLELGGPVTSASQLIPFTDADKRFKKAGKQTVVHKGSRLRRIIQDLGQYGLTFKNEETGERFLTDLGLQLASQQREIDMANTGESV